MSPSARREYVRHMQGRYRDEKSRKEKGRLLTEVSENLNCRRKHAIRVMNGKVVDLEKPWRRREKTYPDRLVRVLEKVWESGQNPWSVRLKAMLPLWMPWLRQECRLGREEERQLLSMSPATMDRRLGPYKQQASRRIFGKTKPGRWLRRTIPIQTASWDVPEPGWLEIDTVSHSGPRGDGLFAYSVNTTDLQSGWVECRAVLGKGAAEVKEAIAEMREAMPFELKGLDSDNGEEFINWQLSRYCQGTGVQRFRSRAYKKDDQAHIEQKNWTHVRKLIGYDRYDTQEAVNAMNDLYRNEWRLFCNLWLPSMKLAKKIRVGAKVKRVYGPAKTPLDRLLESGQGDRVKLEELRLLREKTNPFRLSEAVNKKLSIIWGLASKTNLRLAEARKERRPKFWEQNDNYMMPNLFRPLTAMTIARTRPRIGGDERSESN